MIKTKIVFLLDQKKKNFVVVVDLFFFSLFNLPFYIYYLFIFVAR